MCWKRKHTASQCISLWAGLRFTYRAEKLMCTIYMYDGVMGQNVLSASLQWTDIGKSDSPLVVMSFKVTLTGCGNGQTATLWSWTRSTVKSCTWRGIAPVQAGADHLGTSYAEKDLVVLVDSKLSVSQKCALIAKRLTAFQAAAGRALPANQGRWSFAAAQSWWDTSGCCVQFWAPQYQYGHTAFCPKYGHTGGEGTESPFIKNFSDAENGFFNIECNINPIYTLLLPKT